MYILFEKHSNFSGSYMYSFDAIGYTDTEDKAYAWLLENEEYRTYKVYIVREGDTLESIVQRYGISREELEQYNDLNEINLGDKIIIPEFKNEKD